MSEDASHLYRFQPMVTLDYRTASCEWARCSDDQGEYWGTSCGEAFTFLEFIEGPPTDHHMKFCPYCGKPLVVVPLKVVVPPKEDRP